MLKLAVSYRLITNLGVDKEIADDEEFRLIKEIVTRIDLLLKGSWIYSLVRTGLADVLREQSSHVETVVMLSHKKMTA